MPIEGTRLAPLVVALREELERACITRVAPEFFLSTAWGVPFGGAAVAIPFYLSSPELAALYAQGTGHAGDLAEADLLRCLRHAMGHVVSYAYRLYDEEEWIRLFGAMTLPHVDDYRPHPFSKAFVRHLPGWYAQKHPDEDWAETFAVWLSPSGTWREDYRDWPIARAKLEYCDAAMTRVGTRDPGDHRREADAAKMGFAYSVERQPSPPDLPEATIPHWLDSALVSMFEGHPFDPKGVDQRPASLLFTRLERDLVASVYRWTGHFPERTRALLRRLAHRSDALALAYRVDAEAEVAVDVTTVVTALAMTFVQRGDYAA